MENTYCVYKHTSPSGKVYIGITKKKVTHRWANGLGYKTSPHFWSAIQKYGWDNFSHEILIDGISKEDACAEEQRLIAELNATNREFGYNQKLGGEIGSKPTAEVRDKISKRLREFYKNNPSAKAEISKRVTGFRHSEESKEKISRSKTGRTFVETPDWRKHIGEANREKMRIDAQYYEKAVSLCRENGEKAAKPVVQFNEDGNEVSRYRNAHEAERKTGVPNGNIVRCCKGHIKSAGGYKWRYANEYNSSSETA